MKRFDSLPVLVTFIVVSTCGRLPAQGEPASLWKNQDVRGRLILPARDPAAARLVQSTVNGYLQRGFGVNVPVAEPSSEADLNILAGTPENNAALAQLLREGFKLTDEELGDEGFQLVSHEAGGKRYVVVYGRTPRALKHGCQELVFYRLAATISEGAVEWPLNVVMKPQVPYRGCYILPCWAAYDSIENWARVLRFNSELTLNRNWFWLDGFPVAGHSGEYKGTDLARDENVQGLLDLAAGEDMKILIGGGWFNWHHAQAVGGNLEKGIDYYLQYMDAFRNFHGFYIEPTGEGGESQAWRDQVDALLRMIAQVHERRPEFEFALATGKFNNPEYHRKLATLDPARVFWWWCWGDPVRDEAMKLFPSVLRWHVIARMSDFQGSTAPPDILEKDLAGVATGYDPGQGFGDPWDGWGRLGVSKPRNVDPYSIPYFGHQYYYRERCWNLKLSEWDFTLRLGRRLFDADAPRHCGNSYWWISKMVLAASNNQHPTDEQLAHHRAFLAETQKRAWSPRMLDTLERMDRALQQLTRLSAAHE
jgi:hypothetical protein